MGTVGWGRRRWSNRERGDYAVFSHLSATGGDRQLDTVPVNPARMVEFVGEPDDCSVADVQS
jgi:hypothetical protein